MSTRSHFADHGGSAFSRKVDGIRRVALATALLTLVTVGAAAQRPPVVRLTPGMVITRSVRIAPGIYRLAASAAPNTPVITIRGDNITVDFAGATLQGTDPAADPDQARGLAVLIDGGRGITLRNARIRGYQTAIRAVGTVDLTLLDNDLSHNWKPRLFSQVGHESLIDWLSFHHNEAGEWRRFGAGIALEGVRRGLLRGNRVRQGMNGLLLTRTDSLRIERNDFSFNSGVGIGLYRSTDNVIVRNRVDFNVRGYSHGFYRRGQDSADLLMFEQSSRNVVAWNSMTHGGDGLFLWAGQHTLDTGEGGSNDNLFLANDFSWAPTNGMEATFSRNAFIANRVVGNDHGLWGGYSFASAIVGNCFARNRIGIAVEHGQENLVAENSFSRDSTAIQLWADPIEPSAWGYPKHRDTRSRDWRLQHNTFRDHRTGLRVRQTTGFTEADDRFLNVDTLAVMRDTSGVTLSYHVDQAGTTVEPCGTMPRIPDAWVGRAPRVDSTRVPHSPAALLDRSAIVVDEWGPYDGSTPKLWPIDSAREGRIRFRVLGPPGIWRASFVAGTEAISDARGRFGDTLAVTTDPDSPGRWSVELVDAAGRRFGYEHYDPITSWNVRFHAWTDSTSWGSAPILERLMPRLDMMWSRPQIAGLPQTHWALEATTSVDLPAGTYTLRTISDDAVQVWVDGKLVIDHWTPHESLVDVAPITAGRHTIRARYLQVEGWVELRVEIVRGRSTSLGSPGPH